MTSYPLGADHQRCHPARRSGPSPVRARENQSLRARSAAASPSRGRLTASGLAAGLALLIAGRGLMPAAYVFLGCITALAVMLILGQEIGGAITLRAPRALVGVGAAGGLLALAGDASPAWRACELTAAAAVGVGVTGALLLRLGAAAQGRLSTADRGLPYLAAATIVACGSLGSFWSAVVVASAGLLWNLERPGRSVTCPPPDRASDVPPSVVLSILAAALAAMLCWAPDLAGSPSRSVGAFLLIACLVTRALWRAVGGNRLEPCGVALVIAGVLAVVASAGRWAYADLVCAVVALQAIGVVVGTFERAVARPLVLHASAAVALPAAAALAAAAFAAG